MKIQVSTAIALRDELSDKLNVIGSASNEDVIVLSEVASALILDVAARDELQAEIDKVSGD